MVAVILAGGRGTRLQPYTSVTPKPLVPVAGIPIIELLVRQLVRCGVKQIHVAVSGHTAEIESVLGDGQQFGAAIDYSYESKPLSTVGPLLLINDLPEHFIVVNGDILTDIDYAEVYRRHVESRPALTVVTCERENMIDFGVLDVDDDGRISGFHEKPRRKYTVSAGIYIYSRDTLTLAPPESPYGFDNLMIDLLRRGERVEEFRFAGYWLDIGRPDDYERANLEIKNLPHLLRSPSSQI